MAENCHRKKISYRHGRELPQEKKFHIGMAENCHRKKISYRHGRELPFEKKSYRHGRELPFEKKFISPWPRTAIGKNFISPWPRTAIAYSYSTRTQAHFNRNKTPVQAFAPPADEKKMGAIWIFVYYVVYGSGRGRCRDFLVLKWGGGS